MKTLLFKIPKPEHEALVYQEDSSVHFFDKLHRHDEIQISYIVSGRGSLVIGDTICDFMPNDIFVIGENIPHVFKTDPQDTSRSIMYKLFFKKDSFGNDFFNLSDMSRLESFFKATQQGIKITSDLDRLRPLFVKLKDQSRIQRIATLLQLMDVMISSEKQQLAPLLQRKKVLNGHEDRMDVVINYALCNFHEPLSLEAIAKKAHMSKNAFCRYFKKKTNKTFFEFLIEIRIEYACRLLFQDSDISISEISERCGFANIANFNRKFKDINKITPSQYRKYMTEKWRCLDSISA